MIRILTVVAAMLLVAGCQDPQSTASPTAPRNSSTKTAQIKTIAIIIAFDNRVETKYIASAPVNSTTEKARAEWPIDDYVRNVTVNLLKDRYTIKDVAYSPGTLRAERDTGNLLFGGEPDASERVRRVIQPGTVDAIVFIAPSSTDSGNGAVIKPLEGVGYYSKSTLFFGSQEWVYVSYRITLLDGRTLQTIDYATGGTPSGGLFGGASLSYRDVSGWPSASVGYIGLSPAYREQFKKLTYDIFNVSLPDTLHRLGLR